MATLAHLIVALGVDAAKYHEDLDKAKRKASTTVQDIGATFERAGAKMMSAGKSLTLGVTTPIVGLGVAATKMAADYDANMAVLAVSSGATAEEIERMSALAVELGGDLELPGTSAADAAEAMVELSKAGLSVEDTMAAARGVLQMSAAGQLSNAQAAEIAANALNAFGLEGGETTRVADLLAAAANASSGEVVDMADSLKMAAAVFSAAGVPVEELVTMISQLSNAGIQGSDAGTSLKQMLLKLQAPSNAAGDKLKALGISIYDAEGNMYSMANIIEQFSGSLNNLTQEERDMALATIFGSDAIRAANIIFKGGVAGFEKMKGAVTEQGAAAKLAGARMTGLTGAFESIQNAFETGLLTAIQPFTKDIEALAMKVAEAIERFNNLDEGTKKTIITILGVVAAIGPLLIIGGALVSGLGTIISAVGAVIGILSGPLILVIGAVIAAVALLWMAWKENWGGIREKAAAAIEWIKAHVPVVLDKIREFAANALEKVKELFGAFQTGLETGDWSQFIDALVPDQIEENITRIAEAISEFINKVRAWWDEHGDEIIARVTNTWETIKGIVKRVLDWIRAWWAEHGDTVIAMAENTWEMIKRIFNNVLEIIQGIFELFRTAFEGDWYAFGEALRRIWDAIWDSLKAIVGTAWENIRIAWAAFIDDLKNEMAGKDWKEIGMDIIRGIGDGLLSLKEWLLETALNIGAAIYDIFRGFFGIESPSKLMMGVGQNIVAGLELGMAAPGTGGPGGAVTNNNNYNLTIQTSAPWEPIAHDFETMKAWSRG